jgi:hypothetical protein
MSIKTLSLPIDIPSRRLCTSDDMIDRGRVPNSRGRREP